MQRKNNFLSKNKTQKHRNAMAMIMALSVIVILATIMALSISFTAESTKRTTDIYLYEQSILYSKSAAERVLLDIASATPCSVLSKNYTYDNIYDVNITLRYVYTDNTICTGTGGTNYFTTPITTNEQNGSVLMDITVTTDVGLEPIRYFRRSIQKL